MNEIYFDDRGTCFCCGHKFMDLKPYEGELLCEQCYNFMVVTYGLPSEHSEDEV